MGSFTEKVGPRFILHSAQPTSDKLHARPSGESIPIFELNGHLMPPALDVVLLIFIQQQSKTHPIVHAVVWCSSPPRAASSCLLSTFSLSSKSCCPAGQRCPWSMASGHGGRPEAGAPGSSGLAKPLHLQRLERSLRLDSFLRQTAIIFNRDVTR